MTNDLVLVFKICIFHYKLFITLIKLDNELLDFPLIIFHDFAYYIMLLQYSKKVECI